MPPTTHGTISPHLAAPTYGASPHGPTSHYISFTASCIRDPGANVQGYQYQWNHTHPALLRLPAGKPPAATLLVFTKLDPIMRSGITHAMEPLALTANGLTWCRPQTLGPAPYPSPTSTTTSSSLQMEPPSPLPVKPLTTYL